MYLDKTKSNPEFFQGLGHVDIRTQREALVRKEFECIGHLLTEEFDNLSGNGTDIHNIEGPHCKRTWDGVLCWEATKAGTLVTQHCPEYVANVIKFNNATKWCTENGTWWVNPNTHKQWTNFSTCISSASPTSHPPSVPDMIIKHFESVRLMYNIGYGLSLVSLIIACIIMLYFKKLHCPRNTIHLNLFLSFILRAAISFVKENLLVEYVGFPIDVYYDEHHKLIFRTDMLHWECKLFFTLLNYIIAANYLWILVEAVYLQMIITVSVFVEKSRIKWYILFGWCFPLVSIIPWVIVRTALYNEYCWNLSYVNEYIIHIIYGPITVSVFIQFIIFINIVRILFTKLNASPCPETKKFRYRRLAKSTLILIPLFGVYYIIFAVKDFNLIDENSYAYMVLWWAEFFFNSFQGFILSMLFCFFNHEVQTEFKKRWKRYMIRREGSGRTLKSLLQSRSHRHHNGNAKTNQQNGVLENTCFRRENGIRSSLSYKETVHRTEDLYHNNCEPNERTPCVNNNDGDTIVQTDFVENTNQENSILCTDVVENTNEENVILCTDVTVVENTNEENVILCADVVEKTNQENAILCTDIVEKTNDENAILHTEVVENTSEDRV